MSGGERRRGAREREEQHERTREKSEESFQDTGKRILKISKFSTS